MGLLKPAEITTAFFKCCILGFQGSGKTFTAMLLAYGLAKHLGLNKIAFMDTEKASDWFVEDMKEKGIEFYQAKSRAFNDLMQVIDECEKDNIILIVDSLTHFWDDVVNSYLKKIGRKRMRIQDWSIVKGEGAWADFTERVTNGNLHMIGCGRAGFVYEWDINDDGEKDLLTTGIKMRTEKETSFEYDLVIAMENVSANQIEIAKIKNRKDRTMFKPEIGSKFIHRAHIWKDRSDRINGFTFENPTFEDFLPHFSKIKIGSKQYAFDPKRDSQDRFTVEGKSDKQIYAQNKEIALESIKNAMIQIWPGRSAEETKNKVDFQMIVFGTRSWREVEQRSLEELSSVAGKMDTYIEEYEKDKDIKKAWEIVKDVEKIREK